MKTSPIDFGKTRLLYWAGFFTLLVSGCVTREDIRGIQTDLYTIQSKLEAQLGSVENQTSTVQTSQADLMLDMKELSENIQTLNFHLCHYLN